jgi:hypothetical protein
MIKNFFFIFIVLIFCYSASAQNTNALHFDGVDDVVSTASNISALNITGNITIEAWIKISRNTSQWSRIIGRGDANNRTYGLWIGNPTFQNRILWQIYGDGPLPNLLSGTTLSLNTWYHIAVIRSTGGDAKMYINGVLDCSSTGNTGTPHSTTFPTKIGYGDANVHFPGTIDEVRIWNVVRSATEISNNKSNQISTAPGLVASYQFNQGNAGGSNSGVTTLTDASGNNFHGTLSGFALNGSTSNWIIAGFTLPVTWQSFTAKKQPNSIELNWSTASEQNTQDFLVQYRVLGSDWKTLGSVKAAGNATTRKDYAFTHYTPAPGYNYFQLIQRDQDGQFSNSKVVTVLMNKDDIKLNVFPNPVQDGKLNLVLKEAAEVRLFDTVGRQVLTQRLNAGLQTLNVSGLQGGVYNLRAGSETISIVIK